MRRRPGRALLLLASTLACGLGAEGAFRLAGVRPTGARVNPHFRTDAASGWAEPHPVLGWRNRAGAARSRERGRAWMHFREPGRRATRPAAQDARPGGALVLWTGGSFVQGYGVPDEETAAWRLSVCFPDARIENLGTGGFGTVQAALSVGVAAAASPDLARPAIVLYGMLAAHAERNVARWDWIRALTDREGRRVEPPHGRLDGDGLAIAPFRVIPNWPGERASAVVTLLHDAHLRVATRRRGAEEVAVTRHALSLFADEVRARGGRPVVVLLDWTNRRDERHAFYAKHLAAERVPLLDCGVALDPTRSDQRTGGSDGHPSGTVHARWAACVASWLRGHGGPAFAREEPGCRAAR